MRSDQLLGSGIESIIMPHWVGSIDQVPSWPLPVLFKAKRGLDMNADLPQMCCDYDVLLPAPHMWVEGLGNITRVGLVGILRPEVAP